MAVIKHIESLYKNKTFDLLVEIGVYKGESTLELLNNANIKRYVGIDPYEQYQEYEHDDTNQYTTDQLYNTVKEKFKGFKQLELIRKYSSDAVDMFKDNSIDFLFVDGNHSYKYVLEDLEKYYPKVKKGGIISGDDFFFREEINGIKMVYEAVVDFTQKNNIEYKTTGRCDNFGGYPITWWFVK